MEKFVNQPLKPRSFFTVPLSVLLATFATALGAQSVEAAKPMALRTIMERLGRDMQAVTGAISKEDWPLVAELAPRIAKHAEPPMSEKMRILAPPASTTVVTPTRNVKPSGTTATMPLLK